MQKTRNTADAADAPVAQTFICAYHCTRTQTAFLLEWTFHNWGHMGELQDPMENPFEPIPGRISRTHSKNTHAHMTISSHELLYYYISIILYSYIMILINYYTIV